jgi:hypothetical protein
LRIPLRLRCVWGSIDPLPSGALRAIGPTQIKEVGSVMSGRPIWSPVIHGLVKRHMYFQLKLVAQQRPLKRGNGTSSRG